MNVESASILIVDDNADDRELLALHLKRLGHRITFAENGRAALELMRSQPFDLVLLDIRMPEMDGFQVLEHLKTDQTLRHLPVVVLSGSHELNSAARCIELGAEDYLLKPYQKVLLNARINASLEKKRLRDREQDYLKKLKEEQEKSEHLLLSILPKPIAERLKRGEEPIADSFAEVSVLFADIVDFSRLTASIPPTELVSLLNDVFSEFDRLAEKYEVEKIKTMGDEYMVAAGLPTPSADHAWAVVELALDMQTALARQVTPSGEPLQMRIGVHTGPVVAGVIGTKKFSYDLWGEIVNVASRMQSSAPAGSIQVTAETYKRVHDGYLFQERGKVPVKGKGDMVTYLLTGRKLKH
jgi:adenylate cyclase